MGGAAHRKKKEHMTCKMPIFMVVSMSIFAAACTPDELLIDLPAANPNHEIDNGGGGGGNSENLELCGSNNCNQLNSVSAETTSGPSWEEWTLGTGFSGQGFTASYPGYVEFAIQSDKDFRVRFWLSSYESGYWEHDIPAVSWNGTNINTTIYSGDNQGGDGDDWVQRQTDILSAGSGTLRIQFEQNSSIYSRRLDEVEWWCFP